MVVDVHSNQEDCGDRIINAFSSNHHVLLLAQMQMGKSGAYWYAICKILSEGLYGIKNVLVISGNREKELRAQVIKDKTAYCNAMSKKICEKMPTQNETTLCRLFNNKTKVIWGQDLLEKNLKKGKMEDEKRVRDNTLIVWDESHYAQSKGNGPHSWFKENNLEGILKGDMEESEKRNIRLLTVSATPFSELMINSVVNSDVGRVEGKLEGTTMVRLEAGSQYRGVGWYLNSGRVYESFEIKSESSVNKVIELLEKYKNRKKYAIIRVSKNGYESIVRKACKEVGMACEVLNSTTVNRDFSMETLKMEPLASTVVLITGMLRMGKVLPKEHISMVFEASVSSINSNAKKTDTGLQGLFGRVCGYVDENSNGYDIDVYVDAGIMRQAREYVSGYDDVSGPLNDNAMNVYKNKKNGVELEIKVEHLMPIKINLDKSERSAWFTASGMFRQKKVREWLLEQGKPELSRKLEMGKMYVLENEMVMEVLSDAKAVGNITFMNLNNEMKLHYHETIYRSVEAGSPMFKGGISNKPGVHLTICAWSSRSGDKAYPSSVKSMGGSKEDIWMTVKVIKYVEKDEEEDMMKKLRKLVDMKCVYMVDEVSK
jgi:hypothetical protein